MKRDNLDVALLILDHLRKGGPDNSPPYFSDDAELYNGEVSELSEDSHFIYFKFRFPKRKEVER